MMNQRMASRSLAYSLRATRNSSQILPQTTRRWQSSSTEPETYERSPAKIYRPYMRPFAKVFLGAMFTYQLLYWAWEKLRLDELREQKMAEMKDLEAQVEAYKERQRLEKERGMVGGVQAVQGVEQQGKNKSWFSW